MKILLNEEEIRKGISRLAKQINHDYQDKPLTIIGVLTGCIVILADLIRLLDMPLRVGVVQARSYRGKSTSPGELVVNLDMLPELSGRDVLIVDDIFDTGNTLLELTTQLGKLNPSSIHSAVLLRKQGRKQVAYEPRYAVFNIPDLFVVGYGLDYEDLYRNLPYIAALDAEELAMEKGS